MMRVRRRGAVRGARAEHRTSNIEPPTLNVQLSLLKGEAYDEQDIGDALITSV